MNIMNFLLRTIAPALIAAILLSACDTHDPELITAIEQGKPEKPERPDREDVDDDDGIYDVVVESSYEVPKGGGITIQGKGFLETDKIRLRDSDGGNGGADYSFSLEIVEGGVRFALSESFGGGNYSFHAVREGSEDLLLRDPVQVRIIINLDELPDKQGTNVKGYVYCNKQPLADVVVSDGYEVVKTDAEGRYYINSQKKTGFVFVSFPGGYMPPIIPGSNLPQYFKRLASDTGTTERLDFELFEEPNENHMIVAATDFHLANRTNDKSQLNSTFVPEVKSLLTSNGTSKRTYVITMGDLSWDQFWIVNNFNLGDFVSYPEIVGIRDANGRSIPFFNCMGNHDNDYLKTGSGVDWDGEQAWRDKVGPVYYSFNLGNVHYVIMDNIEWQNAANSSDLGYSRAYNKRVVDDKLAWLKKDLALVPKSTPVVVATHAQLVNVYGLNSSSVSGSANDRSNANYRTTGAQGAMYGLTDFWACFSGFDQVRVLSGHTHTSYNLTYSNDGYANITEHNVPAVCATWWWTGYYLGAATAVCTDGSPGGYGLFDVSGKHIGYVYKGYGLPQTKQFRTYDRNTINMSSGNYTSLTSTYSSPYNSASTANEVYINVWNWGPGWEIAVTESGKSLTVTQVYQKDPYHILCYEWQRLRRSATPTSSFVTGSTHHLFKVTASSAASTLSITVKDNNTPRNTYTETMTRPKQFPLTDADLKSYYAN